MRSNWFCDSSSFSRFIARVLTEASASRSVFPWKCSTSTVVAMKFTRKGKLSIPFRAATASLGAKEDDLTISTARSFKESEMARISGSFSSGSSSVR